MGSKNKNQNRRSEEDGEFDNEIFNKSFFVMHVIIIFPTNVFIKYQKVICVYNKNRKGGIVYG